MKFAPGVNSENLSINKAGTISWPFTNSTNLQRLKNRVHFHWIPSVHYWMSASSWFPTHSLTSNEEETIDYFPKSRFKTLSKASNPSFWYRANTLENLLDFLLFCWKGSSYLVAWNREMYFCSLAYKDQFLELEILNTSFGRSCICLSQIWCNFFYFSIFLLLLSEDCPHPWEFLCTTTQNC